MITKAVFDLAPSEGNPRNSEGDFLRLRDGRILFVYSRFTGSGADNGTSEICSVCSRDNGITWGEPYRYFQTSDFENCQNIMSVSLRRMDDGAVGLFFLIRYSFADIRLHLFRSYDECETFETPVPITEHKGFFVTNNDRVLKTSTGRLLVPGNLHICRAPDRSKERDIRYYPMHALSYFFHSDDDGRTWTEHAEFCRSPFSHSHTGLQETGLIELEPGKILAYFRTDLGMQYGAYSHDDGETWTAPEPLFYFTSPQSPMKIERLDDGRLLAVWNPVPHYTGRSGNWDTSRSPLAAAFSCDNGKTWQDFELLETDSDSGFSYPAVFNEGNLLILGYCAGTLADGGNLNRLRIRTIELP